MHPATLTWQERQSASPIVESVWTCSAPTAISRAVIADPCISITLVKDSGGTRVVLSGPKTKPFHASLPAGYVSTGIRLKTGVFLKNLPTQNLTDKSLVLPADSESRFWLEGTRLQFPDFEHVESLINQLHSLGYLDYEMPRDAHATDHLSPRTHSRQIHRITGLSPYQLYQLKRMHRALHLLKQGMPAVEVASELAFVDQSHLIHASKKFFGYTPKQLFNLPQIP